MKRGKPVWSLAVLFGAMLAFSHPSQAAVFDFSGVLAQADSMAFSQDGVSVTVTGIAGAASALVHQDEDGLGVTYEGDRASYTSASQVDGRDELESLVLTFENPVSLLSATFSLVGTNDQFSLLVDDALLFSGNIPSSRTKSFTADNTGLVFAFGTGEEDDDYKVKGIEVELSGGPGPGPSEPDPTEPEPTEPEPTEPDPDPGTPGQNGAVVPEANSLALLGAGLLGLWRRRNQM